MARRLAANEVYPAHEPGVSQRLVELRNRLRIRLVEAGDPAGAPILFIHGWGGSIYTFRKNIPAVASAGYRVLAVDIKGHGFSDKPTGAREYATDTLREHVLEIFDTLKLDRATIVAHSMGGAISANFARSYPDRVSGLVLLASVGFAPVNGLPLGRAFTPGFVRPVLPLLLFRSVIRIALSAVYGQRAKYSERDIDEYWAPSQFRPFSIALRDAIHGFDWDPTPAGALGSMTVPTLVMLGELDRLIDARAAREHVQRIPNAQCEVVPRSGHLLPEEAPDLVNDRLLRFLGELIH